MERAVWILELESRLPATQEPPRSAELRPWLADGEGEQSRGQERGDTETQRAAPGPRSPARGRGPDRNLIYLKFEKFNLVLLNRLPFTFL